MGVSGVSIFSDDVAQDVRDAWSHWYKEHGNAAKATEQCRSEMKDEFADSDDGPVCVLALALTLWKYGWLDDATKARAMEVIDKRSGLKRFAEAGPKVEKARLAEYAKVKAKLNSPQPERKIVKINLKRAAIPECHLQVGDVFSIPLPAPHVGRGYFRVIGQSTIMREACPVVQLLRIPVDAGPSKVKWASAKSIGIRNYTNSEDFNHRFLAVQLTGWKSRQWDRSVTQVHANVLASKETHINLDHPNYTSNRWENLSKCVVPSLDRSRWPGMKEAYDLYRKSSVQEIADLHTFVRDARNKTGDMHAVTFQAAYRLIHKNGDYIRASTVMEMAKRVDPNLDDRIIQGHILLGLGKDDQAERMWKRALTPRKSDTTLSMRVARDQIDDARKEVAARRAGKPLPVPFGLML